MTKAEETARETPSPGAALTPAMAVVVTAAVCLSAVPLASNRPWPAFAFATLWILLTAALLGRDLMRGSSRLRLAWRLRWPFALFGAVIAWTWLQTVSWLPASWHNPAYAWTSVSGAVSIEPGRTLFSAWHLLGYGCLFWMGARFGLSESTAGRCLKLFALWSSVLAIYGLVMYASGLELILWWHKWAYLGHVTATFVNRNSYATYAGMGFVANLALLMDALLEAPRMRRRSLAYRLRAMLTGSARWWAAGAVLCLLALVLTHSRGGLVATVGSLGVMVVAGATRRRAASLTGLVAMLVLLGAGISVVQGSESAVARLDQTSFDRNLRARVYGRVVDTVSLAPLTGTGLGTFADAFRPHKGTRTGWANWNQAHCTYLELLVEIGLPATLALVTAFLLLFGRCFVILWRMDDPGPVLVAGVAACSVPVLQSFVDFSLQMPAIGYATMLILGLAWTRTSPLHDHRERV